MGALLNYRSGVGVVLFNARGLIWLGHRTDDRVPPWQMPQGGLLPDESLEQAARRELVEEIGTSNAHVVATLPNWLHYDYPPSSTSGRAGQFRGQRHKWLLMHFTGDDAEIDVTLTEHPEFNDWRWIAIEEMADSVVSFKREVYRDLAVAFAPVIDRWLRPTAGGRLVKPCCAGSVSSVVDA